MSPTLTTVPPEILEKIVKELAPPRTSNPPLARRPTIGDRRLGDISRNNSASFTLSPLSQTCKTLYTHCLPHLFGTITVSRRDGLHRLKKTLERSEVLANFARKNARSLSVRVNFRLFHDVSRDDRNEKRINQLGSILRCCSSLTALHLTNVLFDIGIVEILAQMKALRSLSLETVYSGTKISKLESLNELCRKGEEWEMEYGEEFPSLEALHFSPQLRSYSYGCLISAAKSSLKELSIHRNTGCLRWTHHLVSIGPEPDLWISEVYFPCLERFFIQRSSISPDGSSGPGSVLPFLRRHRETLKEFTIIGRFPLFKISVPELQRIMRLMAGEDLVVPDQHGRLEEEETGHVYGFSAVFGERLVPIVEGGRRPVLELGLSLSHETLNMSTQSEFPMLNLGALLGPECFDEVELIAFEMICQYKFFFSEFITQLENACTTRFTKLKDISLSWHSRYTFWSRSEPRRFSELPSSSNEDSCELNEEWVSANYSIAEGLISGLFQRTKIERLELVPILDLPFERYRAGNFTPFESWVWQKSRCDPKAHGKLWKRSKRAPFIAVGIGSERETDCYWTEPIIDDDESDELQCWGLEDGY